ncbi:MAG: DUF4868 domain-containing protein [Desulfovibrio sp.]|nr:DUF4868 domain-containing protein [Desulfovibrio sp.]
MSIEKVKSIFESLPKCSTWSLQLLRINNSKQKDTAYVGREIILSPEEALTGFVSEISSKYVSDAKAVMTSFTDILEYDGTTMEHTIYKLDKGNQLISEEYNFLLEALAKPDTEVDPFEFGAKAYVLCGSMKLDEMEKGIKLISMQKPVTTLKHKFLRSEGTFKEIKDKIITLRTTIDVIIFDEIVYMLTFAGENLFNMERAYRKICEDNLQKIKKCNIVTDFKSFKDIASKGHNPRKFVSFNDKHLQGLKNAENRKRIAKKFFIPMVDDKFNTTEPEVTDKLIKLLCDRGMVDPFDDTPKEVSGSKKWN